jgi:hypothetical protein
MSVTRARRAHLRLCAFTVTLATLATAAPARAEPPPTSGAAQARPADRPRRDTGGGLLLLSFLVPLPVPMAFVAPASTRPPSDAAAPRRDPPKTGAPARRR